MDGSDLPWLKYIVIASLSFGGLFCHNVLRRIQRPSWMRWTCSDHVEMVPPLSLPFRWPDKGVVNPSVWIRAGQNYASSLTARGDLTQLYRPPLFPLYKDWCFPPGKGLFEKGLRGLSWGKISDTLWSVEENSFSEITHWSDLMLTPYLRGHFKENASVGSFYDVHVWE